MMLREHDTRPSEAFVTAYLDRLAELVSQGCQITTVQLYTIARGTAEAHVSPVSSAELQAITQRVRERLPGVAVYAYA